MITRRKGPYTGTDKQSPMHLLRSRGPIQPHLKTPIPFGGYWIWPQMTFHLIPDRHKERARKRIPLKQFMLNTLTQVCTTA